MILRYGCILAATSIALLVAGCGDTKNGQAGSASSAAPSQPPATYSDTDLIVPEDFEEEADKVVTRETYQAELAKLAKEIRRPAPKGSADPGANPAPSASSK